MASRRPKKGHLSTLNPYLAGTEVHDRRVARVNKLPKGVPTRPVTYRTGYENIPIPELQDHLLLAKGYLPKYSGLPLEYFAKSGGYDLGALEAQMARFGPGKKRR